MLEEKDLYGPFLANVRDTAIASSYVDENRKRGLKSLSKLLLNYEQETYEQVTTKEMRLVDWDGRGKEVGRWVEKVEQKVQVEVPIIGDYDQPLVIDGVPQTELAETISLVDGDEMVKVRYKMGDLTARHVLNYGADDAICTIALANHFMAVMEIEDTYEVFDQVETFPAYLTALAFVHGTPFSLQEMAAMEKEDDAAYDKSWAVLRDYLITLGFEGTVCPEISVVDRAAVKLLCEELLGWEFTNLSRKADKLAKVVEQWADERDEDDPLKSLALLLSELVKQENVDGINRLLKTHFRGEPKLDLASPKQMKSLLYDFIGIPIQVVNDLTINERIHNEPLADAVAKFKKRRMGKPVTMTDEDMRLLRAKAKTDDTAIDYALAFDADKISDEAKVALKSIQVLKKVMTRRSLFYKNYWGVRHWKDGLIHASANQCAAVTRRYSMSNPNLQQLPKKGEGVRFRGCFKPHHKDAVICSIDYTGQELRLAAERSQDRNMLACYIGDKLKDIHSITAAGAMKLKWSVETTLGYLKSYGMGLTDSEEGLYELFMKLRSLGKSDPVGKKADDLRKDSKNVNFAAQFGGQAAKLSETLIMRFEDAQLFLDARSAMFPDVDKAAKRAADFAEKHGYAVTMMGARRHLYEAINSGDKRTISAALRQAWNMEIQGSAGEMTKIGMTRFWLSGALFKYDARFIAPIHDELVTSVHKDHAVEFIRIKHECMTGPYADMKVPILGSISIGPDLADQHECGDWFIEDNIRKALADIFKEKETT